MKKMPKIQRNWLIRPYRLGQHMKLACQNYHFEYTQNAWRDIQDSEQALLNVAESEVYTREVAHMDGDTVLATGYSIIPKSTYDAFEDKFTQLGDNPIGDALLYDNPAVTRSPFFYHFDGECWSRASVFWLAKNDELMLGSRLHGNDSQNASEHSGNEKKTSQNTKKHPLLIIEKFSDKMPKYVSKWGQKEHVSKISAYAQLMRLHKPKPILLSLWPAYWGLWLAADGAPGWKLFIIFTLGTILMRACGCVFNDLADRDVDGFVDRTRMRPLATGLISVPKAIILGLVLALIAFGLVLLTNEYTVWMAVGGMCLTLVYPLMKRVTHFPQIVLGLAFNLGLPMAFSAVQNHIPTIAWWWYGAAVVWTVMYDTYYALADREDDIKIGVKSTAVFLGGHAHTVIVLMQAALVIAWFVLLRQLHAPLVSYIFLLLAGRCFMKQFVLSSKRTPVNYIKAFIHNHWVGLWMFCAILFCFWG